ncbi:hypothetical protein Golax_024270, partial [Gossypium laxum]|nr:hypothetical protein [Gossypium laxum]
DNYLPIPGEAYGSPRAFWRLECVRDLDRKDVRAWSGEATGEYTVRSAYKWLIHNHYGISTDGNFYPYSNLYKRLWNIDLPSKIKITTWRTMNKFLPTYANLYYQRLMNSVNCPRCHNGVKIVEHDFASKIIDHVLGLLLETTQAVLTGAQMGFLNVEVEGDCFDAHALAIEVLKRNEAIYLVDDVPTYAFDVVEVDRQ